MRNLRDMNEWTDIDGPLHDLAIALGIIPKNSNFATEAKGIYWSKPKPNLVTDILTLQKEFQRLHAATGLNKTSMIQILRAAVPAIVPTGFVKS